MSKDIKITKIPMVVSIVMLLLGIFGGLPIGFYQLLRLVICGAAIYIVYVSYNLKKTAWCWIMGFVALIFNPLFQLHLGRDLWVVMDFVTLLLFIIAIFAIGVSEKKKLKINKKLIKRILIIIGSIVVLIFLIKWGFYYYDITVEYPKRLVEDEYSPSQWVRSLEGDITIYGWMVNRVWTKPNTYLVSYVYAIAKDRKESKTRGWWWEVNTKEKIVKYAMEDVGLRERYGLSLSSEATNIRQISKAEISRQLERKRAEEKKKRAEKKQRRIEKQKAEREIQQVTIERAIQQEKVKWRRLQRGMSKEQVKNILGEPLRVDAYSFIGHCWYYGNGGKVTFDHELFGTVYYLDSWYEPPWDSFTY